MGQSVNKKFNQLAHAFANIEPKKKSKRKTTAKLPEFEEKLCFKVNGRFHYECEEDDGDDFEDEEYEPRKDYFFKNDFYLAQVIEEIFKPSNRFKKNTRIEVYAVAHKNSLLKIRDALIANITACIAKHPLNNITESLDGIGWYLNEDKDFKYETILAFDDYYCDPNWDDYDTSKNFKNIKKKLNDLGIKVKSNIEYGIILFKKEEDANLARLTIKDLNNKTFIWAEGAQMKKSIEETRKLIEDRLTIAPYYA